jgi:hypothetical protein
VHLDGGAACALARLTAPQAIQNVNAIEEIKNEHQFPTTRNIYLSNPNLKRSYLEGGANYKLAHLAYSATVQTKHQYDCR